MQQLTAPAVLVLSGGAPNSPLVAGALAAIYSQGKTFSVIYTSGAGALLGMLFLAPKGRTVPDALKATLDCAIDDRIYNFFPVGYKTFFKSGSFTTTFIKAAQAFQITNPKIPEAKRRLYNDWIDFWFAAACPTNLSLQSLGLCHPVPFVSDVVDFNVLSGPDMRGRFFMNAYCIEDARTQNFGNEEITEDHFHAALAFPFVYSPAVIKGKHYLEGSDVDPINFPQLEKLVIDKVIGPHPTLVLMDLLGAFEGALVRTPRNLLDAFGISIISPICSLARKCRENYELQPHAKQIYCIGFNVEPSRKQFMLDWTYSNMTYLWQVGWDAGIRFASEYPDVLPDRIVEPGATDTPPTRNRER